MTIPVKIVAPGEGSQPARNFAPGSCRLADANSSQPVAMRQEDFAVAAGSPAVAALNPAAWFKWNQGVAVSQWDDASGNGRHLKQATATNQPAVQADGSLLFDGVDNFMKCDAFTLNQPVTVYALLKQVTWTLNDIIWDGNTDATMYLYQSDLSAPRIRTFAGTALTPTADLALDTYGVVAAVYNGASSLHQVNNQTATTGNAGAANPGGFHLGTKGGAANGFSNIQVREVIIFNAAHDAITRETVVRYLRRLGGV
jgi:hypothetical protein